MANHEYSTLVRWTGNTGAGTRSYRSYQRRWDIAAHGKPVIHCSNDPLLGGDPKLMNPEDLLLSALSACHMLRYLHLACDSGIVVHRYEDEPSAQGGESRGWHRAFFKRRVAPANHPRPR